MAQVELLEISKLKVGGEEAIDWGKYGRTLLAQGDSWFSIGALPPQQTTSILTGLCSVGLNTRTLIINAARPGKELKLMMNTSTDSEFVEALMGSQERTWSGILFSGGGNDLIAAVRADPDAAAKERLLQRRATPSGNPADYVSEAGWGQLADHLNHHLAGLLDNRARSKQNRDTPLLLHNYADVQPRNVGTFKLGPWFYPALVQYGVPVSLYLPLAQLLMGRMAALLQGFAQAHAGAGVVLVDSLGRAGLQLAAPHPQLGTDVASGDFLNEIHPTQGGYLKLAKVWQPELNRL